MFGRKTLEFMLMCIGDEMRDSLFISFLVVLMIFGSDNGSIHGDAAQNHYPNISKDSLIKPILLQSIFTGWSLFIYSQLSRSILYIM